MASRPAKMGRGLKDGTSGRRKMAQGVDEACLRASWAGRGAAIMPAKAAQSQFQSGCAPPMA
eukprot:8980174-Heterocapsa_arctica.AAC.1